MLELSQTDMYEGQSNLNRTDGAQGDGFELGFWQFEAARLSLTRPLFLFLSFCVLSAHLNGSPASNKKSIHIECRSGFATLLFFVSL